MVQVYRDGADRKVEIFDGEMLLKLNFQPDLAHAEDKPSKVTGTLFEGGKNQALKAQLLDEMQGQGDTEKEALLNLVEKLLAAAKEEKISKALENIKIKIISEGIGFADARYIPPSMRS
ncbi:hypothetical protein FAI41_03595 [Acetobacteraceae bacterium]|nr:hypothetical protein FAI41_03595 [Acetobacteraceae bacterium]